MTKIYFLVMLISVFVGLSYTPRRNLLRIKAKKTTATSPDSMAA